MSLATRSGHCEFSSIATPRSWAEHPDEDVKIARAVHRAAAEVELALEAAGDDDAPGGIEGDRLGHLIQRLPEALAIDVVSCRVEPGDEDVGEPHARQRASAEIDVSAEGACHQNIAGAVHRHRAPVLVHRAVKRLVPHDASGWI